MYLTRNTKIRTALFVFFFFAISLTEEYAPGGDSVFRNSSFEYCVLIMLWMLSVRWRITDTLLRRYLMMNADIMLFFMMLRMARYMLMPDVDIVARNIWYLYYLPAVFIALDSFFIAYDIGVGRKTLSYPIKTLFTLVSIAIVAAIATNDLHGMAYYFENGPDNWETGAVPDVVSYIAIIWIANLYVSALVIIKRKFYDYSGGVAYIITLIPIFCGCLLMAASYFELYNFSMFKIPEIYCFTVMAFWEAAIQTGMIASNSGYTELFRKSASGAVIYNNEGKAVFESELSGSLSGDDTAVHRMPINGGYIEYYEDISEINRVNEALEDMGDSLAEEQAALVAANKLREEEASIREKNEIYDETAKGVLPQSMRIAALSEEAEKNPDKFSGNLKLICFLGSYIKRRANTAILASANEKLSSAEIRLTENEIFSYLAPMGITAIVTGNATGLIRSETMVGLVDSIQGMTESVLETLKGVIINISETEDNIKIRISFESPDDPLVFCGADGVTVSSEREDDCFYVTLLVRKEGEA